MMVSLRGEHFTRQRNSRIIVIVRIYWLLEVASPVNVKTAAARYKLNLSEPIILNGMLMLFRHLAIVSSYR